MPDPVEKSDFYPVKANTPVTLSIKIGEGQVGGTDVSFDGASLGSGAITNLPPTCPSEPRGRTSRTRVSTA